MNGPLARSFLFVPGDRPERFDKAAASAADVVVIDLEDAVVPERKVLAREAARAWLDAGGRAALRINAVGTDWHAGDLALLGHAGLVAAMTPKAEDPGALAEIAGRLRPGASIVALVESALGVWNALGIASVPGVSRLAFGSIDFQLDVGLPEEGVGLLHARSRLVLASAAAGKPAPVDGVTVALEDEKRLAADVAAARSLGFGGKLCVHPVQAAPVNRGFAPSESELAWARAVVAAAAAAASEGAIRLDGKLIDRPVVERARRMIGPMEGEEPR